MNTTIGPDGLTDEERDERKVWPRFVVNDPGAITITSTAPLFCSVSIDWVTRMKERLAAERLTHAETRARAEKAEAERDRLRAALEMVSLRQEPDGPCWCVFSIPKGSAHHITCLRARALLGEVKP